MNNDDNKKLTINIPSNVVEDLHKLHGINAVAEINDAVDKEYGEEARRVFHIDLGELPPVDMEQYLTKLANAVRRGEAPNTTEIPFTEDYFFSHQAKPAKKFLSTKTFGNDRGLSCCFRQWRSTHSHCSQVHGYSIGVKFVFECDTLDERNWVMDFGGLKGVKQWLEHMFDHTMCVAEDDPMLPFWQQMAENPETAHAINLRVVPAVGCERFSELVFDYVTKMLDDTRDQLLNPTVRLKSVEVFEHGANSAICERS